MRCMFILHIILYINIGAEVSWGIHYSSLHLSLVQSKAQTSTHHSATHHLATLPSAILHTATHYSAAHHTAAHYVRHLSRYARYSSPTHYLSHTI